MNKQASQPLYKSITRRYLLAVLIILILSTVAWLTLQSALSESEYNAYIVNISGRQRMLSQHIALDAHRLNPANQLSADHHQHIATRLRTLISDMAVANRQLSSGVLKDGRIINLTAEVREIFFGEINLSQRVINYLDLASQVLDTSGQQDYELLINQINDLSEPLLKDLNSLVYQYQLEGEQRVSLIKKIEMLVWTLTVITLLLEIFFIFKPMALEVIKSKEAEENVMSTLQEQVELRTLKLESANKKLEELATRDPLTNLKNRLTLENDIEKIIRGFKEHNVNYAVCLIDIDWFKNVNDTYGHLVGDFVLKTIARLFENALRSEDQIYRSGGEEFVILLNRIDLQEAVERLEQLREMIKKHAFDHEGSQFHLTVSSGLYHSSLFAVDDMHDVLKAADDALYVSKEAGRNRLSIAEKIST